jgi:hypothetical protein
VSKKNNEPNDENLDESYDYDETEETDDPSEELGYAQFDWDKLPTDEVKLHDRIISGTLEDLKLLDAASFTDLHKWAAAQVYADEEDAVAFQNLCDELVRGPANHPALDYGEISLELANDLFTEERYEEARELLPLLKKLNDPNDDSVAPRFEASLDIMQGHLAAGLAKFQELVDANETDPGYLLTVGEDLIGCGRFVEAVEVLDKAEEVTLRDYADETDLLEEIAEAREFARSVQKQFN